MLYQQSTHGKGKEISLSRDVLDALVLKEAIVTLDSLHCLAPTMAQITEKEWWLHHSDKKEPTKSFRACDRSFFQLFIINQIAWRDVS